MLLVNAATPPIALTPAIARVDRWLERPGLPLSQPQQAGDAHPGTDEDDEREQPHSQTPGEACLRSENIGGSRRIPKSRSAGPADAGDRSAKGLYPFQLTGLARGLIHHARTYTPSRAATGRRGLEGR